MPDPRPLDLDLDLDDCAGDPLDRFFREVQETADRQPVPAPTPALA